MLHPQHPPPPPSPDGVGAGAAAASTAPSATRRGRSPHQHRQRGGQNDESSSQSPLTRLKLLLNRQLHPTSDAHHYWRAVDLVNQVLMAEVLRNDDDSSADKMASETPHLFRMPSLKRRLAEVSAAEQRKLMQLDGTSVASAFPESLADVRPRKRVPRPSSSLETLVRRGDVRPGLKVFLFASHFKINASPEPFTYDGPMRHFLESIRRGELMPEIVDLLDESGCPFYEGCVVVELRDYRRAATASSSSSSTSTTSSASLLPTFETSYIFLEPTTETFFADLARLQVENGLSEEQLLQCEADILLATKPALCLDPSPRVGILGNLLHFHQNQQRLIDLVKPPGSDNATTMLGELGEVERLMRMDEPPAATTAAAPTATTTTTTPSASKRPRTADFEQMSFIEEWRRELQKKDTIPLAGINKADKGSWNQRLRKGNILYQLIRTLHFARQRQAATNAAGEPGEQSKTVYSTLNIYMGSNGQFELHLRWGDQQYTSVNGRTLTFTLPTLAHVETYIHSFNAFYANCEGNALLEDHRIPVDMLKLQFQLTQLANQQFSQPSTSSSSTIAGKKSSSSSSLNGTPSLPGGTKGKSRNRGGSRTSLNKANNKDDGIVAGNDASTSTPATGASPALSHQSNAASSASVTASPGQTRPHALATSSAAQAPSQASTTAANVQSAQAAYLAKIQMQVRALTGEEARLLWHTPNEQLSTEQQHMKMFMVQQVKRKQEAMMARQQQQQQQQQQQHQTAAASTATAVGTGGPGAISLLELQQQQALLQQIQQAQAAQALQRSQSPPNPAAAMPASIVGGGGGLTQQQQKMLRMRQTQLLQQQQQQLAATTNPLARQQLLQLHQQQQRQLAAAIAMRAAQGSGNTSSNNNMSLSMSSSSAAAHGIMRSMSQPQFINAAAAAQGGLPLGTITPGMLQGDMNAQQQQQQQQQLLLLQQQQQQQQLLNQSFGSNSSLFGSSSQEQPPPS